MTGPLVISFYTRNHEYPSLANRLRDSCDSLHLDHFIVERDSAGSWVKTCAMKGPFVLQCLQRFSRPVLWVDADGFFIREPKLIQETNADFAIYAFPGPRTRKPPGREDQSIPPTWPESLSLRWFNTGTIFFECSRDGLLLADAWATLCTERPTDWDQWSLQEAWAELQPETLWLPSSYCQLRRATEEAVIFQDLASRNIPNVQRV